MDVGRAFRYMFDDPRWLTRLLIAGALLVIPVVNFFGAFVVTGYSLLIIRNVLNGYDLPLPGWDDVGGLFIQGLKTAVVHLVWTIPIAILMLILLTGAVLTDNGGMIFLAIVVIIVLGLALAAVLFASTARYAWTGSIEEGLNVRVLLPLVRSNLPDYAVLLGLSIVLSLIASAGVVAVYVGLLFTTPYAMFVLAHLIGQAYYRTVESSRASVLAPTVTHLPPLEP